MTEYRIEVNRENCVGDGLCREGAGGTFDIDKEIRCAVREAGVDSPEDILFAAWNCPNRCITLHDAKTGEQIWPGKLTREQFDELARRKAAEMDPGEWAHWRDLGGGD
jgi:ferredoxin